MIFVVQRSQNLEVVAPQYCTKRSALVAQQLLLANSVDSVNVLPPLKRVHIVCCCTVRWIVRDGRVRSETADGRIQTYVQFARACAPSKIDGGCVIRIFCFVPLRPFRTDVEPSGRHHRRTGLRGELLRMGSSDHVSQATSVPARSRM